MKIWRFAAALFVLTGVALAMAPAASAAPADLVGTFKISAGSCAGAPSGSYFRMVTPTGTVDGPFVNNVDSTCSDHTYTLLSPGTDGGLSTAGYQPAPSPGFDKDGNSLAKKFVRPVKFFGVDFSLSTEASDLQTKASNPVPRVSADAGKLTGDLRAVDATYNSAAYNQGSPKPDGSRPGLTTPVSGTYDAATGKFVLTWTSQIVGGDFNNFTGLWHLEGTFTPAATAGGTTATTAKDTKPGAAVTVTTVATGGTTDVTIGQTTDTAAPATVAAPKSVTDKGWEAPTGLILALVVLGAAGVYWSFFKMRALGAVVIAVALVGLAFIAIKTKGDATTTTTTKQGLAFVQTPTNATVSSPLPHASQAPVGSAIALDVPTEPQLPLVGGGGSVVPPADDPGDGPVQAQLTCPAPLPAATHTGGLANVSGIVPLFGPFSAEAFTFVPAFTPAFPVLGPFFPVFEAMIAMGQPLLDAGIPVVNQLENTGFDALAPLYNPVRPQILAGEAQGAAALNPLVEQLATTPGTGCVADVADILASLFLTAF